MADRKAPGWYFEAERAQLDEAHLNRRVFGLHDIRFDGLSDLLMRARGASVIDVGMNKGHLAYDFAINGARLVHGCDIYRPGVLAARQWFAELPHVQSKFEVVDLTKPNDLRKAFGSEGYDIVIFVGVYHKLTRVVGEASIAELLQIMGEWSRRYFAWMGYNPEMKPIDAAMSKCGLRRVHTSELAHPGRSAAIWKRGE